MNAFEHRLKELNTDLYSKLQETIEAVELLLGKYSENFPTYTDHSYKHTKQVFKIASELLTKDEILNLNGDEIYVLSMACILHDVGMCIPEEILLKQFGSDRYKEYREVSPKDSSKENLIRDIHHRLSYDFIMIEQKLLCIPSERYAEAIAVVAMGHRKEQLDDTLIYKPKYFVRDGREFVCLPYLACILRLADELDITNIRTPKLLTKYYMPNNEVSIKEWKKHIATTQINYTEDKIIFQVSCSDQNNLAALEDQFEKIQDVANYSQKVIRNISNTEGRVFSLNAQKILPEYKYIGFDPKGIKFSFNVNNVVKTFIGKDLYKNDLTALREVLQNAIDSCRYKVSLQVAEYSPEILIEVYDDTIIVHDNGLGMDEFIIENFFGKLGSSFYAEEEVKLNFEAIGQFGVGVFSYFLLGEYIDIETKTNRSQSLKFRIDRDPKNYFHFYKETKRKESGTSITIHLSKEIIAKYAKSDYVDYLFHTFRYIEIPISIEYEKTKLVLKNSKPECKKEDEIQNRIKFQYRDRIDQLKTISYKIINEKFEGECSIIVPVNSKNLEFISELFSYDSFETNGTGYSDLSSIQLSQKGVYVTESSIEILHYTVGQVNVLKSLPININRNEFSNSSDVDGILNQFAIGLIEKMFEEQNEQLSEEEIYHFSNEFLEYYFDGYHLRRASQKLKNQLEDVLGRNIKVKYFNENGLFIGSLKDFIDQSNNFVILSDKEDVESLYKKIKCNILIISGRPMYNEPFREVMHILQWLFCLQPEFSFIDNVAYASYKLSTEPIKMFYESDIIRELSGFEISDTMYSNSRIVCASLMLNKPEFNNGMNRDMHAIINLNHEFVIYIIKYIKEVNENSDLRKLTHEAFELITLITFGRKDLNEGINQLNSLITPLSFGSESYKFKTDEFVIQKMSM